MSSTRRADVQFTVKEFESGRPWIAIEQLRGDHVEALRGTLGFDLKPGTTLDEAKVIALYLRQNVVSVSETK